MKGALAALVLLAGCYQAATDPAAPPPEPVHVVGFQPALSADGRYLAFASFDDLTGEGFLPGGTRVYRLDFDTAELRHVSSGLSLTQRHQEPTISASGHRIAFRSMEGLAMSHSAWEEGEGAARTVSDCSPGDGYMVVGVRVLAEGSATICAAQGADLRIRRIEWTGGAEELQRIALVPGEPTYTFGPPAASADGSVIGFNQPGVRLLDPSGAIDLVVPDFAVLAPGGLSSSGRHAALQVEAEDGFRVVVYDRDTGEMNETGLVLASWGNDVAISGDGGRIAFADARDDTVHVGVLDVLTGEVTSVDTFPPEAELTTGVALSADGQTLVYVGEASTLTRVAL